MTAPHVWKPAFLQAFSVSANWVQSSAAANVSRHGAKEAYARDPEFRRAVDEAKEAFIESLELAAVNRAVRGGSDRLLEFLLRAHRPELYDRARQHMITGPDGGPLQIDITSVFDARIQQITARLESAAGAVPQPNGRAANGALAEPHPE